MTTGPPLCFKTTSQVVDGASSLLAGGGCGGVTVICRPIVARRMHGILVKGSSASMLARIQEDGDEMSSDSRSVGDFEVGSGTKGEIILLNSLRTISLPHYHISLM